MSFAFYIYTTIIMGVALVTSAVALVVWAHDAPSRQPSGRGGLFALHARYVGHLFWTSTLGSNMTTIEGSGARDQENAGTGRVLYGYFDPGFRGERGIEQLQQRIAGRTYPHLCGRRHPAGKR